MATPAEPQERQTRGARRRAQTRGRLLDAARTLFARQGVDATAIAEITEEADVGFGSFYNHFSSKEEIVEAVLAESVEVQGAIVDALTRDIADPAEVVAVAHRHFVQQASEDPSLGWLLVRLDASHRVMLLALGERAVRDLIAGIDAGRFQISDPRTALVDSGGALVFMMRAVLDGGVEEDAAEQHAENILRMFGLPPEEAAEIARRPLPKPADADPAATGTP
jgi:AcrR family transcriptional regulator